MTSQQLQPPSAVSIEHHWLPTHSTAGSREQGNDRLEYATGLAQLLQRIENSYGKIKNPLTQSWQTMTIERVVREADDVRSFYLIPSNNRPLPNYRPGQHILLRIPAGQEGNVPPTRCYTISGLANPLHYRITVKRNIQTSSTTLEREHSNWASMSGYLHRFGIPGLNVEVRGPSGHFSSDLASPTSPLVLLSAGIGVTPSIAIANRILPCEPDRPVWMFYQTRTPTQTPLASELLQLARLYKNFHLVMAFSQITDIEPDSEQLSNVRLLSGRIAPETLAKLTPHADIGHAFLCGPNEWMHKLVTSLGDCGFDEDRIHFESFGGQMPSSTASHEPRDNHIPEEKSTVVQLLDSHKKLQYRSNEGSLLDQLQRGGADVTGGCRAGSCGSCITRLLSGSVKYSSGKEPDIETGWILPCVAQPTCDIALQL